MPDNTVYVGRPTKWGNPFNIGQIAQMIPKKEEIYMEPNAMGGFDFYYNGKPGIPMKPFPEGPLKIEDVLKYYKGHILEKFTAVEIRAALGGKNLACWCPLDKPCHADVLLEIANGKKVKKN